MIVIDNPVAVLRTREILSLLRPMDVVGGRLVRIGRDCDGGYVMLEDGIEGKIAYSFGIGGDVSWDLDIINRGGEVYCYDHTINSLPVTHPKLHWKKIGIAGKINEDLNLKTMKDIIEDNHHENINDIILKMDIEDCEWEVFESLDDETLARFSQIVVEMHGLGRIEHDGWFGMSTNVMKRINKIFQAIHIHGNNFGGTLDFSGVILPDFIEVTYARKDIYNFKKSFRIFPTELDRPNNPAVPDIFLGALGCFGDAASRLARPDDGAGRRMISGPVRVEEIEHYTGLPPAEFMTGFESLGDNCEFGLVQRHCGAEPVDQIFRFAATGLEFLLHHLPHRFEGLEERENLRVEASGVEYGLHNVKLEWARHSFVPTESPLTAEEVIDLESKRIRLQKRAFFENLAAGRRIYVFKSNAPPPEAEVVRLHEVLNSFGPAVLMWAVADGVRQVRVEELRPGLFKVRLERFAPYERAYEIRPEQWIAACVCVWRLLHGAERGEVDISEMSRTSDPPWVDPSRWIPPEERPKYHERPLFRLRIGSAMLGDTVASFPALYQLAREIPLSVAFDLTQLQDLWAGPPVGILSGVVNPSFSIGGVIRYFPWSGLHMIQGWFRNLGLQIPKTIPRIPLAGGQPLGRKKYDVIISPFSVSGMQGAPAKIWPYENWCRVIDALLGFGLSVAVCGVFSRPNRHEAPPDPVFWGERPVDVLDGLPLAELVGYLRGARCVATVDNGIAHLVHLLGVPHAHLVHPAGHDPLYIANRNPNAVWICEPFRPGGERGHALLPERVLAAIFEVLGSFDPEAYVGAHEDLTAANVPGWDHWVHHGREEGRNPGYTPAPLHYGSLWRGEP